MLILVYDWSTYLIIFSKSQLAGCWPCTSGCPRQWKSEGHLGKLTERSDSEPIRTLFVVDLMSYRTAKGIFLSNWNHPKIGVITINEVEEGRLLKKPFAAFSARKVSASWCVICIAMDLHYQYATHLEIEEWLRAGQYGNNVVTSQRSRANFHNGTVVIFERR